MLGLASSSLLQKHPDIAIGITLDLVVTMPLVYFICIRKQKVSKLTIVPVAVGGLFISGLILPESGLYTFHFLKQWVFPLVELFVITVLFFKIRKSIWTYRKFKNTSPDFMTVLRSVTAELIGSKILAALFITEISVVYYALFSWGKPKLNENQFSVHRTSGAVSLFLSLLMVIGIETTVVHILLAKWSVFFAWLLTGTSIYLGLQFIAHIKALKQRPIIIEDGLLKIRNGIFGETEVPLQHIEELQQYTKDMEKGEGIQSTALLDGLEPINMKLKTSHNETLLKPYGIRKLYKKLYFYVDNPSKFLGQISQICPKT